MKHVAYAGWHLTAAALTVSSLVMIARWSGAPATMLIIFTAYWSGSILKHLHPFAPCAVESGSLRAKAQWHIWSCIITKRLSFLTGECCIVCWKSTNPDCQHLLKWPCVCFWLCKEATKPQLGTCLSDSVIVYAPWLYRKFVCSYCLTSEGFQVSAIAMQLIELSLDESKCMVFLCRICPRIVFLF